MAYPLRNLLILFSAILILYVGSAAALTVEDVVKAAVSAHPSIRSQLAQVDAAVADIQTAKQQFYPTPSISVERINGSPADVSYGNQSTVQLYRLQQPLWTGGRLTAGLSKAQSNARMAAEGLADVRQQMALRATQAWSEWYLATMRIKAQEQSVEAHRRLMSVVQRRVAEGAMAPSELNLTQSRLDQAEAQLQNFQAQQKVARLKISQLIGRQLESSESPEISDEPETCPANELQSSAIEASAALKKIKAQKEAAGYELQERQAELTPELYVRLERQKSPTAYGANDVTNDRVYVGFSSRFGPGLSNMTVLQSLEKRRDAIQAEYEALERNLLETVQSDYEQLLSVSARLPLLKNALQGSTETAQAWDRQFLAGRRAWVEVMNAAREMAQAEIDLGDANASQLSSQWRLSIYCGAQKELLMHTDSTNAREAQK